MKRKVNKVGQNTLTVSLPVKWVNKYGIRPGQEINVDEDKAGQLSIGLKKQVQTEKAKIHIDDPTKFLRRTIHVPYRRGVDELEVTYTDPRTIKLVSDAITETIGFEIVKQGNKYCIIKNVAAGLQEEFDVIFNRLFMIIKTMASNSAKALKTGDESLLEEVKTMEETAQKLVNFCCRELYNKGYKDETRTIFLYGVVRGLERVADWYYRQAYVLTGEIFIKKLQHKRGLPKPKISKETAEFQSRLLELIDLCYEMTKKFDYNTLIKFRDI
jgi:phosphate uptake regulator